MRSWSKWRPTAFPCLVCGVDSFAIKVFLGMFIGSLVLATISLFVWTRITKRQQDEGRSASMAIEADERE